MTEIQVTGTTGARIRQLPPDVQAAASAQVVGRAAREGWLESELSNVLDMLDLPHPASQTNPVWWVVAGRSNVAAHRLVDRRWTSCGRDISGTGVVSAPHRARRCGTCARLRAPESAVQGPVGIRGGAEPAGTKSDTVTELESA